MKLKDIPKRLGLTKSQIANIIQKPKQTVGQYFNGQRGKQSKVVEEIAMSLDLDYELVFWRDAFDYPLGATEPLRWINLAIEALETAKQSGADADAEKIITIQKKIIETFLLIEINAEDIKFRKS
jgi:transcriptional regulator with XRE-family HTH domain